MEQKILSALNAVGNIKKLLEDILQFYVYPIKSTNFSKHNGINNQQETSVQNILNKQPMPDLNYGCGISQSFMSAENTLDNNELAPQYHFNEN